MEISEFIKHFENAIEGLEPGSISPETVLSDLPQWDSLALLTTLAMIDSEYEVQLSGAEIQQCRLVGDLITCVADKLQK